MAKQQVSIRLSQRWTGWVRWGVAAVFVWGFLGSASGPAQQKDDNTGLQIILSTSQTEATEAFKQHVGLRPNVDQGVFLFVQNNDPNPQDVVVHVAKLGVDGEPREQLAKQARKIPGNKAMRVSFAEKAEPKAPEVKAPEGKPAPPPPPPPQIPLDGPPFRLRVNVEPKGG